MPVPADVPSQTIFSTFFFFKLHLFLLCVCMCVRGGRGRNAIDFALAHSIQIIKDNPRKKT